MSAFSRATEEIQLAPALYQVLVAVLYLDEAMLVYGDDIAGLEPAVLSELLGAFFGVEVALGYPGAADLQLAHGLAVPRNEILLFVASPHLDERDRGSLLGLEFELFLLGEHFQPGGKLRDPNHRAHLRQAPAL